MGAEGTGRPSLFMTAPEMTAHTWCDVPGDWIDSDRWLGEWMTVNGQRWFARISPCNPDPEGAALPPIVMLHGLTVSGTYFRPIASLIDDRYAIYVPDMPGSGRSPSPQNWSLPSLTTQLADWMEAHDLTSAIVVGNSVGAQVATWLATTRPDLVRALVLISPTHDPSISNMFQLLIRAITDVPRERISLWTIWIPDLVRTGARRSLTMLRQMFTDDQLERLGDVRQRALVIGGERDPIVSSDWVRDMASRMPNGEAIIIPDGSHALNYSNAPELVAAIDRAIDLPF
jgi:pimeloyl-ACP methyl ester carboxylesterase